MNQSQQKRSIYDIQHTKGVMALEFRYKNVTFYPSQC